VIITKKTTRFFDIDHKIKIPLFREKKNMCSKEFHVMLLTDRELDVLKLLANGLSNSRIAEPLFISENTVKRHISNILSQLHLADRTQAAAFAWREGIVRRAEG
jgi:DNA-binding NarL/FixJ family response regulator